VLLDGRRVRDFYRAFMEEIKAESPELTARILARLEALNASVWAGVCHRPLSSA